MKVHRFYTHIDLAALHKGQEFTLASIEQYHQIANVLRIDIGEIVNVFNEHVELNCELLDINKKDKTIVLLVKDRHDVNDHQTSDRIARMQRVHIYMSFIKKNNFELVIEKMVELGIGNVTPLISARVEKSNILANSNTDRLSKIIIEATEQSGRNTLLHVNKPKTLDQALHSVKGKNIFLNIQESKTINDVRSEVSNDDNINIYIGPEGGWTDVEIEMMKSRHFISLNVAPYTLRAETAAIVAASIVAQI